MTKTEALELLGGSIAEAARRVGVTYQAVDKWPDVLPARIVDRVQAALWRESRAAQLAPTSSTPLPPAEVQTAHREAA